MNKSDLRGARFLRNLERWRAAGALGNARGSLRAQEKAREELMRRMKASPLLSTIVTLRTALPHLRDSELQKLLAADEAADFRVELDGVEHTLHIAPPYGYTVEGDEDEPRCRPGKMFLV